MRSMMYEFLNEEGQKKLVEQFKNYQVNSVEDLITLLYDLDMNVGIGNYVEDEGRDPEENNLTILYSRQYTPREWNLVNNIDKFITCKTSMEYLVEELKDQSTVDPTDSLLSRDVQSLQVALDIINKREKVAWEKYDDFKDESREGAYDED